MKTEKVEEKEKKYIFRKIFIIMVVLIISVILYSRYIGTKGLIVKEYKIESKMLPSNFSGMKIVHFSDIYYGNTIFEKELNIIANRINELKPDLILFTGNLYTNDYKLNDKNKKILVKFLNSLNCSTGKYLIKGFSDFNIDFESIISETDFILLNNTSDLIYFKGITPIFIGGIPSIGKDIADLEKVFQYYKSEEEKLNKAEYKIIMSSEGNVFESVLKYDNTVNLLLGSASLNGSVKIPFYGPLYIPKNSTKYYAPYYKENNSEIFISSGIGTDNIKFRFNNKPSFNFYRLKSI